MFYLSYTTIYSTYFPPRPWPLLPASTASTYFPPRPWPLLPASTASTYFPPRPWPILPASTASTHFPPRPWPLYAWTLSPTCCAVFGAVCSWAGIAAPQPGSLGARSPCRACTLDPGVSDL